MEKKVKKAVEFVLRPKKTTVHHAATNPWPTSRKPRTPQNFYANVCQFEKYFNFYVTFESVSTVLLTDFIGIFLTLITIDQLKDMNSHLLRDYSFPVPMNSYLAQSVNLV